jgi:hypothetical protein
VRTAAFWQCGKDVSTLKDFVKLCRVEKWQVDLWCLKLKNLHSTNQQLAEAHCAMTDRVLALEDELQTLKADEGRAAMLQDLAALPMSQEHQYGTARF